MLKEMYNNNNTPPIQNERFRAWRKNEFGKERIHMKKKSSSCKNKKKNCFWYILDGSISHDKRLSSPTNNFPMKSDSAGRAHYYNYFNNDLVSNLTKRLDEQSRVKYLMICTGFFRK